MEKLKNILASRPNKWIWSTGLEDAESQRQLKEFFESVLENRERYLLKRKLHREVLCVSAPDKSARFFIKIFQPTRLHKRLRNAFLFSSAAREFSVSKRLLENGILTAEPVAMASFAWSDLPGGSLFISQEIREADKLSTLFEAAPAAERQELVCLYGRLLAKVHRLGLFVSDPYMENVLVNRQNGLPELYLLDHEATRPVLGWFSKWRETSLVQALLSDASPPCSDHEISTALSSYLEVLHGSPATEAQITRLFRAVRKRYEAHVSRLATKASKKRFKRRELCGDFRVYRRRDVNGTLLIQIWEEVAKKNQANCQTNNLPEKLAVLLGNDCYEARLFYHAKGAGKGLNTLGFSAGCRQYYRQMKIADDAAMDRELLGYVEHTQTRLGLLIYRLGCTSELSRSRSQKSVSLQ